MSSTDPMILCPKCGKYFFMFWGGCPECVLNYLIDKLSTYKPNTLDFHYGYPNYYASKSQAEKGEKQMSETKPIYYTLDDNELNKLRKITINGEPLSTKQLHELITSQAMTIDRLLGEVERYRVALKEIANIYEDGEIRLTTMTDRCVQIAQNTLKDAG